MYVTLRRNFYWPQIITDVNHIVSTSPSYVRNNPRDCHCRKLQLLPASIPILFAAMDIMEPPSEATKGNHYIHVIIDRDSKLIQAIPTLNTTAMHIANIVFDH